MIKPKLSKEADAAIKFLISKGCTNQLILASHKSALGKGGWQGLTGLNEVDFPTLQKALVHGYDVADNDQVQKEEQTVYVGQRIRSLVTGVEHIVKEVKTYTFTTNLGNVFSLSNRTFAWDIIEDTSEPEYTSFRRVDLLALADMAIDTGDKDWFIIISQKIREMEGAV